MGELILCSHPMAAMPYYIDLFAVNVYSLEEISCCIEKNYAFIEEDFMDPELAVWIKEELSEEKLAEDLVKCQKAGNIVAYVKTLLYSNSYTPDETVLKICEEIRKMQEKSAFELGKIRADRYAENGKYMKALGMYRRLLQMKEDCVKNSKMHGMILHNLGSVYARLFEFDEALNCFLKAYDINHMTESLNAYKECTNFAGYPAIIPIQQDGYTLDPERLKEWVREYKEEHE